jgi:hypothetical protein
VLPVPVGTQQGTGSPALTDGRLGTFVSGWGGPAAAAGLSLLASLLYAVLGTGYVLDDWFTLRYAHFDGAWAAAGPDQHTARPGAAVVYAVVFGIGQHPLAVLAIQAVIGAATAALLVVVFRAYFPAAVALGAALLWVVLPNHTSLEVWASATNIALCVLLAVAGTALLRSPQRAVQGVALVLFAAAALCYEAVIPLVAVLIVVVPWVRRGRPDWPLVAAGAVTQGAVALWIVTHWHPGKHVASGVADLTQVLGAHFGWGIAPDGPVASVLLLAGLIGTAVAVARVAMPSLRSASGPAERAVLTGWAVIVLGTLPFAKYLYAPLGAGDRFNFVSAIGGALVWAGLLAMLAAWRRPLALAAIVVLVAAGCYARVERAVIWHRAAHDARAIQQGVLESIPDPQGVIVIGPAPIQQQNIAAYLDQSNIAAALQIAYGRRDLEAGMAFDQEQFDSYPPEQRFDIRPVSQLQPDTVVDAG